MYRLSAVKTTVVGEVIAEDRRSISLSGFRTTVRKESTATTAGWAFEIPS